MGLGLKGCARYSNVATRFHSFGSPAIHCEVSLIIPVVGIKVRKP